MNEMMAHGPQSPAGETRANRFTPFDQFEDAGAKARWRVYVLCAAAEVPLFFSPDKQGNGHVPILHCTNKLRADNRRISGKRTGGLSGEHQAQIPPVAREKAADFLDFSSEKRAKRFLHSLSSPVHGGSGAPPGPRESRPEDEPARRWGPTPARPPSVSRAAARATPPPRSEGGGNEQQKRRPVGAPFSFRRTRADQRARVASRSSATMLVILIIGLTAGPAVSLYGSPTVSPVTAALWASEPLPP